MNLDKDPMERRVVALAPGPDVGDANQAPALRRAVRFVIRDKTLWNATQRAWREDGRLGVPVRNVDPGEWRNS